MGNKCFNQPQNLFWHVNSHPMGAAMAIRLILIININIKKNKNRKDKNLKDYIWSRIADQLCQTVSIFYICFVATATSNIREFSNDS